MVNTGLKEKVTELKVKENVRKGRIVKSSPVSQKSYWIPVLHVHTNIPTMQLLGNYPGLYFQI